MGQACTVEHPSVSSARKERISPPVNPRKNSQTQESRNRSIGLHSKSVVKGSEDDCGGFDDTGSTATTTCPSTPSASRSSDSIDSQSRSVSCTSRTSVPDKRQGRNDRSCGASSKIQVRDCSPQGYDSKPRVPAKKTRGRSKTPPKTSAKKTGPAEMQPPPLPPPAWPPEAELKA